MERNIRLCTEPRFQVSQLRRQFAITSISQFHPDKTIKTEEKRIYNRSAQDKNDERPSAYRRLYSNKIHEDKNGTLGIGDSRIAGVMFGAKLSVANEQYAWANFMMPPRLTVKYTARRIPVKSGNCEEKSPSKWPSVTVASTWLREALPPTRMQSDTTTPTAWLCFI